MVVSMQKFMRFPNWKTKAVTLSYDDAVIYDERLMEIMKKYDLQPKDLLVVDDMKPAYDMAKAASVEIAFAGWGRKDYPQVYAQMKALCDYTFDTPEELSAFLF